MSRLKSIAKTKALAALSLVPFGRDMYLTASRKRQRIGYRGLFDSYRAAQAATSPQRSADYDVINRNKADNQASERAQLDSWFHDIDYAVLFWLGRLLAPQTHLLELGGSVGHFYYSFKKYLDYPQDLRWTIAELPEAVKLGRAIAEEREAANLAFVDSADIDSCQPANIFLTAGTLQYMEADLGELLQRLQRRPHHVLVHNLPVHQSQPLWTLQDLGSCEVPYRIYGEPQLGAMMSRLGYEQVTSWKKPRTIEIPFHLDIAIEGYCGYYFRAR